MGDIMKTLLDEARIEIDDVDKQMAKLFERRMKAVEDVIKYKIENNKPIFDACREKNVIAKNVARIENDVYKPYYEEYINQMMRISKEYQRTFVEKRKVAYQGSIGAFSQIAATKLFENDDLCSYHSFEDVFKAVDDGEVSYGVIPFENSYTGEVGETLDLLYKYPNVYIEAMYDLKVNQNLLGIKGSKLEDIKEVYSHGQALSQCSLFLKGLQATRIPYLNTALAAKYVSEQGDKSKAAIASIETAKVYDLEVLEANIADSINNTTRFMVIQKSLKKQGNRFSLLFSVDHKAGSLADIMEVFKKEGFNLENIKSRSTKSGSWQYYFYVELVGNLADTSSERLIELLKEKVHNLRIIGTYTL